MERFKMIAAVFLVLLKGNKVLMLRRKNTGYADGKYTFPSGHVEDNEPLSKAVCREAGEEVGILLSPKDVQLVHIMHRKGTDIRMDFFFTTKKKGLRPKNAEPHRADDLAWFPANKLPLNTISYIPIALKKIQKRVLYSEINWN